MVPLRVLMMRGLTEVTAERSITEVQLLIMQKIFCQSHKITIPGQSSLLFKVQSHNSFLAHLSSLLVGKDRWECGIEFSVSIAMMLMIQLSWGTYWNLFITSVCLSKDKLNFKWLGKCSTQLTEARNTPQIFLFLPVTYMSIGQQYSKRREALSLVLSFAFSPRKILCLVQNTVF